jgi:hypothetical protein
MCIPSLMAAAFLPTSRWGGWVAVGGGGKAAKEGKSPFMAKIQPFIRRLSASQTSELFFTWNKRCGILYVDAKKCFKKLKLAYFLPSYDLFSEVWFFYFSLSLESCSSASSEAILNFLKDLKSPVHALFTMYYNKFSFNQVFRSKKPCGFAYSADFRWFLCVSYRSWWGGAVAIAAFPPPPRRPRPPP